MAGNWVIRDPHPSAGQWQAGELDIVSSIKTEVKNVNNENNCNMRRGNYQDSLLALFKASSQQGQTQLGEVENMI